MISGLGKGSFRARRRPRPQTEEGRRLLQQPVQCWALMARLSATLVSSSAYGGWPRRLCRTGWHQWNGRQHQWCRVSRHCRKSTIDKGLVWWSLRSEERVGSEVIHHWNCPNRHNPLTVSQGLWARWWVVSHVFGLGCRIAIEIGEMNRSITAWKLVDCFRERRLRASQRTGWLMTYRPIEIPGKTRKSPWDYVRTPGNLKIRRALHGISYMHHHVSVQLCFLAIGVHTRKVRRGFCVLDSGCDNEEESAISRRCRCDAALGCWIWVTL